MNINTISSNVPAEEGTTFPAVNQEFERNVRQRTESAVAESFDQLQALGVEESKMESSSSNSSPILVQWKNYILAYRTYVEELRVYQEASDELFQRAEEEAKETGQYPTVDISVLPLTPILPFMPLSPVPVLLANGASTQISPEEFLLLFNQCDFIERQLLLEFAPLTDSLELPGFEEAQFRAALQILQQSAITEEAFSLGGIEGVRLVEFLSPRQEILFTVEPSLFMNLAIEQEMLAPENEQLADCQINLPVSLNLEGTEAIDLTALHYFPNMRVLSVSGCHSIADFTPIASMDSIESLNLSETNFSTLSSLLPLHNLRFLSVEGCEQIADFSFVSSLTSLEMLNLSSTGFVDLGHLANLLDLRELYVASCQVTDLRPLLERDNSGQIASRLRKLEVLDLNYTDVSDISAVSFMPLKRLILADANEIENFEPLRNLQLEQIDLAGTHIQDLSLLAASAGTLRALNLMNCEEIANFNDLNLFPNLEELNLSKTAITQIAVLQAQNLRKLNLNGCDGVSDFPLLENFINLQWLGIDQEGALLNLSFLLTNQAGRYGYSLPQLRHLECPRPASMQEAAILNMLRTRGVEVEIEERV